MVKVKKIDAPLLVIGLGGTGFDALMRIKRDFSKRFEPAKLPGGEYTDRPPRTEFLEIDTDGSIPNTVQYGMKLAPTEFCDIRGNVKTTYAALKTQQYVSEWVDPSIINATVDGNGAGQVRQIARLFLFQNIAKVRTQIEGKIKTLAAVGAGGLGKSEVEIKIIAGICGGTGSGTLLDIAYIIKDIAETNGYNIKMQAYLLMPDIMIDRAAKGSIVLANILRANGYSLLRELDAWMSADVNKLTLKQRYSELVEITWQGIPFDEVFLQCAQNDAGKVIADAYDINIGIISEYLIHCYESSDDSGTEKKEILNKGAEDTTQQNSLSFQSIRANEAELIQNMPQPYPVAYRYHTLGAFSNEGEDRLMELTEWEMIYSETIAHFTDNICHMDGTAPEDFRKAVLAYDIASSTPAGMVRSDFDKRYPMTDIHEDYPAKRLHEETDESAPHGSLYDSYSRNLELKYGDEKLELTDEIRRIFENEARTICEDIKRGPQFLLDLLKTGENSLTVKLSKYIGEIDTKFRTASEMKENHLQQAKDAFHRFKEYRTPIVPIPVINNDLYNNYMEEALSCYDATLSAAYYKALKYALEQFQKELVRFVAVFADVVTAIHTQNAQVSQKLKQSNASDTLFDTHIMTDSLTALFAEKTRRDTLTRSMFKNVMDITLACVQNAATDDELRDELDKRLDALRENEFAQVGSMTLTQKITAYEHISSQAKLKDYVENKLGEKFDEGARVMFCTIPIEKDLPNAGRTSIITIPDSEQDIADGFKAYCQRMNYNVILKRSAGGDRVFWVSDKCGLPMYWYGQMGLLEDAYVASSMHRGYHLFMSDTDALGANGVRDEMRQDWRKLLPNPVVTRAIREADGDYKTLRDAQASGVLNINISFPITPEGKKKPTANVCFNRLKKIGGLEATKATIQRALGDMPEIKDALALDDVEKSLPTLKAEIDKLMGLLGEARALIADPIVEKPFINHLEDKANEWGNVLGTANKLIALDAAMDDVRLDELKEAWTAAYGRAVREALVRRPYLIADIARQATGRGLINARIAALESAIAQLNEKAERIADSSLNEDKVIDSAADLAKLLMYGIIDCLPAQIIAYPETEEEIDLFADNITVEQLHARYAQDKSLPQIVRLAAYMSHNGAGKPIVRDVLGKCAQVDKKISHAKKATSDVADAFKRAKENLDTMKVLAKKLRKNWMDEKIDDATNAFGKKVLDAIQGELNRFIETWEDYIDNSDEEE